MKKVFAFLLSVLMVFGCAALADEPFKLHADTQFGMSSEEVTEKEITAGNYLSVLGSTPADVAALHSSFITIAGVSGSVVSYYFYDDQLFNMEYTLNGDNKETAYANVSSALNGKYGPTEFSSATKKSIMMPTMQHGIPATGFGYIEDHSSLVTSSRYFVLDQYEQWLVVFEGGDSVLIDHCIMRWVNLESPSAGNTRHFVFYTYFDAETTKRYSEKSESVSDDL